VRVKSVLSHVSHIMNVSFDNYRAICRSLSYESVVLGDTLCASHERVMSLLITIGLFCKSLLYVIAVLGDTLCACQECVESRLTHERVMSHI